MRDSEIAKARKILNGETPSGRVYEANGKPEQTQTTIPWPPWPSHDITSNRPHDWRKDQSGKDLLDILAGK